MDIFGIILAVVGTVGVLAVCIFSWRFENIDNTGGDTESESQPSGEEE